MALLELEQKELTDISRTHGKVYETAVGEISYTRLVNPEGFVLLAKDDQLRFYLLKKPGGVWEHVWGASSIVHDGMPTSEELIRWRLNHALNAGKQGLDAFDALSGAALDLAAGAGTNTHKAAERLLQGKEVIIAGRSKKEMWAIGSLANWISDNELRNWQTEKIVAHDGYGDCSHEGGREIHEKTKACDGVRYVYGGTTDLVIDIYNETLKKWETWLIDYKTSANVYLDHKVQASGYKPAYEMSYGRKIDRVGILLLGKQTQKGYLLTEVGKERNHKVGFEDFKLAYRMVLMINNGKLPLPSYKTFPKSIKIKEVKNGENNSNNNSGPDPAGRVSDETKSQEGAKLQRGVGSAPKKPSGAGTPQTGGKSAGGKAGDDGQPEAPAADPDPGESGSGEPELAPDKRAESDPAVSGQGSNPELNSDAAGDQQRAS